MPQRYHIVYDDLYADTIHAASDEEAAKAAVAVLPKDQVSYRIEVHLAAPGDPDAMAPDDYDGSGMQDQMRKRSPLISIEYRAWQNRAGGRARGVEGASA